MIVKMSINQVHAKDTNVPEGLGSARLKIASSFNESARASSGMGAARTATCERKETASMRDLMINIYHRAYVNEEWVEDQLDNPVALDVILYLRLERSISRPVSLSYCGYPCLQRGRVLDCDGQARKVMTRKVWYCKSCVLT